MPPFSFGVHFRRFVSPPGHDGGLRGGFDVGVPCHSACVLLQLAFLHLPPPLRHACGSREVFDGGLPQHSASLGFAPPATLAVREKFLAVVCLIVVPAFPSITFLRVFPGFVDKPFRGDGVGFEEPHL